MLEEVQPLPKDPEQPSKGKGDDDDKKGMSEKDDKGEETDTDKRSSTSSLESSSEYLLPSLHASSEALIVRHDEDSSDSCDGDSDSDSVDIELDTMEKAKCDQKGNEAQGRENGEKKMDGLKRGDRIKKRMKWVAGWLWRIFPPPTISIILGILIGVCPFLKREVITHPRYIIAGFTNAIDMLGKAAPSFTIIILGIGLANMPSFKSIDKWGAIMGVVGKQVLVAGLGVPVVAGLYYGGVLPEDPVVAFTMLVEGSTPAAINLIVICQLTDMPVEFASAVLFLQYLCAPVLVGLSTVAYVYLSAGVFV